MRCIFLLSLVATLLGLTIVLGDSSNIISDVTLADTSHLFLVPGAQTLEDGFGSSDALSTATELSTITVITTDDVAKSLSSVAAAYRTINPLFNLVVTKVQAAGQVHSGYIGTNQYDFAIAPTAPTIAEYQSMPSLEYLPILTMGVAPVYNLPLSFTSGFPLRLTMLAICRIYRGNITVWADPTIISLNPGMNWAKINPNQPIEVVTISVGSGANSIFTGQCSKIDPIFAAQIGVTGLGSKYLAPVQTWRGDLGIVADTLADHPFSFACTTISRALAIPLAVATIVTSVPGTTTTFDLTGDPQSVTLNMIELASKSTSFNIDLINPTNPQAWPMGAFQYLFLDNAKARVTCSNKRALLDFLIWIYSNDLPSALFTRASLIPIPDIIKTKYDILSHLRNDILCDNAALVSANAATLFVSADAASADLVSIYSDFYGGIDSSYSFSTRTLKESLSLQRLRVNEAAFALVRTGLFVDADLDMIDRHGFISIPAFMTGIVPIFNLPTAITAMAQNVTGQLIYALPQLYPLVLDINTMTRIFLGNITSWLDAHIIALNPQLKDWFDVTNANTTLTVVVGASGLGEPSAGAKVLFSAMQSSDVAKQSTYRKIFGSATQPIANNAAWKTSSNDNPFSLVLDPSYMDSPPTNFIMLDYETRLSIKTSVTPGSIGYRTIGSQGIGVSDQTVEFRMVQTNTAGVREVVSGTTANMNACNAPHFDSNAIDAAGGSLTLGKIGTNPLLDINSQREWINVMTPPVGCYPLFVMISIVMPMQYTSNDSGTSSTGTTATTSTSTTTATASSLNGGSSTCLMAEHGIEFANYIQSTASLSLPAEQLGLVRLASSDIVKQLSQSVFYASTCDGLPVLVTVPSYFSISSAISQFGYAIGSLGLITTAISLVLVMLYRHRVIIRSSSVPFLVLILCGVGFLYVALIAWSYGPTSSSGSCTSFVWFSQLGFMMVYIPLFAKTYRVWRIFSGSHLKVVKLSNRRLIAMSLAAIGIDLLILAIWQGVSPIQPIVYTRQLNDHWDYYTHCSVTSTGLPFVMIEAVYKAGILLFGALMAFSTRNVKATFNESTQIAWSIYNTLLAAIIVAIMITFLNAIQSTLIILVQIFLLWVAFCTWALVFIPKFQLLLKSEKEVIETSMSELLPQEKSNGYSFASVAFMSGSQLKSYYEALKIQVIKVQQRLGVATTKFEPVNNTETIGAINSSNSRGNNSGLGNSRNQTKNSTFTDLPNTTRPNSTGGSTPSTPAFAATRLGNKSSMTKGTGTPSASGTPRSPNGITPAVQPSRSPSPPNFPSGSTNVLMSAMKPTPITNQMISRLGATRTSNPPDESSLNASSLIRQSSSSASQRYQPIHVKAAGRQLQTRLSVEEHNNIHQHYQYTADPSPKAAAGGEETNSISPPRSPPKTPPTTTTALLTSPETPLTLPPQAMTEGTTTSVVMQPFNVRDSVEPIDLNQLPQSPSASPSPSVSQAEAN